MWNETLEARAAEMRAKAAAMFGPNWVGARLTPAAQRRGLEKTWKASRARGNVHRNNVHIVTVAEPRQLRRANTIPDAGYPACPHCKHSAGTIRAGHAKGIQRYRCVTCRRTFSGPSVVVRLEPCDYDLICYHCGSKDAARIGRGHSKSRTGRLALCHTCGRKFVQGGLHDLQRCHLVLEDRISRTGLPADVGAEVLQMAYTDVLEGKGYCWSVDLRVKEAWFNTRGEYRQMGSDHPEYRKHNGQKMVGGWDH